uniref:Uncharacterized protein n=1 Tax=Chromera velia CCMP2878 TaxID=1169474 RepID=A0A0G4IBS1_9ALVE|eukprot:Cvel_12898.t1-p1 / transcript=Cvel_12898.t1 / gene=Cvel_12898 / organism=Chromera_velia_CCMP2878 / gene_product=hypothetical protein / transcript_product=hypothetical protein / location=Cvel_scaffold862:715-1648(-) / protein_length=273 / sequence_SO=supercontig / SO=protein_coding / is_pseudo=false
MGFREDPKGGKWGSAMNGLRRRVGGDEDEGGEIQLGEAGSISLSKKTVEGVKFEMQTFTSLFQKVLKRRLTSSSLLDALQALSASALHRTESDTDTDVWTQKEEKQIQCLAEMFLPALEHALGTDEPGGIPGSHGAVGGGEDVVMDNREFAESGGEPERGFSLRSLIKTVRRLRLVTVTTDALIRILWSSNLHGSKGGADFNWEEILGDAVQIWMGYAKREKASLKANWRQRTRKRLTNKQRWEKRWGAKGGVPSNQKGGGQSDQGQRQSDQK